MSLVEPALRIDGGNEFIGSELGLQLGKNFGRDSPTTAFLGTGLVTREEGIDAALAHGFDPLEKVTPRHTAQIGDLSRGGLSPGGEFDREQTVLAPAVRLLGMQCVNNGRHLGTAKIQ